LPAVFIKKAPFKVVLPGNCCKRG